MGRPGHPGPLRNGWHKCCDRGLSPSPLADGRHTVLGSVIAFYRVIVSYFMQLSTSFQISWETAEKTLSFSLANGRVIVYNAFCTCRCDGIGRRSGLKIHRWRQRTGSSPVTGTILYFLQVHIKKHCTFRAVFFKYTEKRRGIGNNSDGAVRRDGKDGRRQCTMI